MAPATKAADAPTQTKTKQKTLMGFFTKDKATPKVPPLTKATLDPKTPTTKRPVAASSSATSKSSVALSTTSRKDTPPSSDVIDVDMTSDAEEDAPRQLTRLKRKIVVEDSDEDEDASSELPVPRSSPTPAAKTARPAKRPRASSPGDEVNVSFTKQLSSFKQPPPKGHAKSRSRSSVASDDDFIAPSDDEDDGDARAVTSEAEASEEEAPKPKKKAAGARPPLTKAASSTGGGSSTASHFLTAAEERLQTSKQDKKDKETCFDFLNDVRDKDGNREGDANYDPRTLFIPKSAWTKFTPFEVQFWEIKQNHYDTVLFFQKGKFYELYEQDARIGHQEFDLKLTERVKMCMVGVPEMSFNFWASKFIAKGYKVGKVSQSETALGAEMRRGKEAAGAKDKQKLVKRSLDKVLTTGTLFDPELLQDDEAGHCISVRESTTTEGRFGVCVLDCATADFSVSAFDDDVCRTRLETMLRQLRVKEIVHTRGNLAASTMRLLKNVLPGVCMWTALRDSEGLTYAATLEELKTLYPADGTDGEYEGVPEAVRGMLSNDTAIEALGAMVWYLRQLNIDKDILSMRNFHVYDPMRKGIGLLLDGQTLAHLEVLLNSEGTKEGSLLELLGRCVTPFGKRLFRMWLCMPLRGVQAINDRLDAVEDLIEHSTAGENFAKVTKGLPDLERLVSRIHAGSISVKDFLKVVQAFGGLNERLNTLDEGTAFKSKLIKRLLKDAPDLVPLLQDVECMYESPEEKKELELVPQPGKDEAYDEILQEIAALEMELDDWLKKLEKQVGYKIKWWHSAQGTKEIYLVEIARNKGKLPKTWRKNSDTKAVLRYDVPELAGMIRSMKEAREHLNAAQRAFRARVFAAFDSTRDVWLGAVRVVAELDCLFGLAKASTAIGATCRPVLVESDSAMVEFRNLKHPALCLKKDEFIPNDVVLGGDAPRVMLLTGPNMGGKSTLMRMTAAGVIMAQLGMLLPADSARISPVDCIMTRMGAYDNMFSNSSTFKVELDECCKILDQATPKSLVILDELGRGTSTYDGMAIAGAVLHRLASYTLSLSCFATHYSSLTDDYAYHPQIRNMHMATNVDDDKRELVFLYKLVDGVAAGSFGTHVASLAGVPHDVVARAEVISDDFARKFEARLRSRGASALPMPVQADFAYLAKLARGVVGALDASKQKEILRTIKASVVALKA